MFVKDYYYLCKIFKFQIHGFANSIELYNFKTKILLRWHKHTTMYIRKLLKSQPKKIISKKSKDFFKSFRTKSHFYFVNQIAGGHVSKLK